MVFVFPSANAEAFCFGVDTFLVNRDDAWKQSEADTYMWTWFDTEPVLTAEDLWALVEDPPNGLGAELVARMIAGHPSAPHDWVCEALNGMHGIDGFNRDDLSVFYMSLAGNRNIAEDHLRQVWESRNLFPTVDLPGILAGNPATPGDVLTGICMHVTRVHDRDITFDAITIAALLRRQDLPDEGARRLISELVWILEGSRSAGTAITQTTLWYFETQLISLLGSDYARRWMTDSEESYLMVRAAYR